MIGRHFFFQAVAVLLLATTLAGLGYADDTASLKGLIEGSINPSLPVIKVDYKGHSLEVPHYEQMGPISPQRKVNHVSTITGVNGYIKKFVEDIVLKGRSSFTAGPGFIKNLSGFIMERQKEHAKLDTMVNDSRASDGFVKGVVKLLQDILGAQKTEQKLDKHETFERLEIILDGTTELAKASPVGLYLNWRELKVDGQYLVDYTTPIIGWMRRNGYGLALSGADKVVGLLKRLNMG